ncbi:XkdF-like putative serine protease domain-containing protein [Heyndrickxia sp. NPDC080065]|uniref:XkdF-like putative serine protease domain-containing protein n=1 Tax=Heyndrickxia sp. NPDC080065 TaxID=3390568 RepID=UPI003CFD6783
MPRELINANITHVSYVDKGANKKQFFFTKSDKQPDFKKEVKLFVSKEDKEQQLVYGVVYEPDIEDSHGDFMTAKSIEKAAHGFMKDARNIDKQHDFNAGVGEVVESYIAPSDFTIGEETITKGSWVLVTKASNDIWEEIKKGDITGYSMAGTAETIEKEEKKNPVSKSNDDEEVKGFFNLVKSFFQKGEVRDNYERNQKRRNLWAVWDGIESAYYESVWDNRTPDVADFERIEKATIEFLEIIQEIKKSGDIAKALENQPKKIKKAGKKLSATRMEKINAAFDALNELRGDVEEEEEEVKKEDIEKMLDEKISAITKRLDSIEKEEGNKETPAGEDEVLKQFGEVLDQKLAPINDRLDAVEKARGISKQADNDEGKHTEVKKSVWDGLL